MSFNKQTGSTRGTDAVQIEGYGQWSDVVTLSKIGEPLYSFYGYAADGVYKDLDDLQSSPQAEKYPANGVFNRWNTTWGRRPEIQGCEADPMEIRDGKIDTYDRVNIGSPMPKFTYGFNNTFRYKNMDLTIFINGTYGNKIFNYMAMELSGMTSIWNNQLRVVTDRAHMEPIDPNKVYPITDSGNNTIWNWFDDITNVRVTNLGH